MLHRIFSAELLTWRKDKDQYSRNLSPRPLTDEEIQPIAPGLSALLEEAVRLGTFPDGTETPIELANKGLVKESFS